jgi:hypothetical protein
MAARNPLKTAFKKSGYVYVPDLLSRQAVELFTQYALFKEGFEFTPELGATAQVNGAHSSYGDPFAESLLLWAQEPMEQATGLKLFPTYSYYRVYRNGHSLAPHKDRPSCEVSATVCFEFQYNRDGYEWPIKMDGTDYVMKPGDALIYRGCELEHSREAMEAGEGAFHVQAFIHYVDADGPYSEHIYDGRPALATPPPQPKQPPKRPYIFTAG